MRKFSMRSVKALLLAAALCCGGQASAWHEPDVSNPIGMELEEDEGNAYNIFISSLHQYKRAWVGIDGSCDETVDGFYISLKHPSERAETAYLKLSLENPSQRSSVTFRVNGQDRAFDEKGSIWITPEDYSKSENLLEVPFVAEVTAPGAYPYIVEAYVNQNDQAPVAKIEEAAFYVLKNMPELSLPSMIYDNQFKLQVKKGDLEQINAYVVVELYGDNGAKVSFAADGFALQEGFTYKWKNTPKTLVDEEISGTLSSETNNSTAHCQAFLYDEDGCQIAYASCDVCRSWTPAETDQKVLQEFVTQNSTCTELVDYINNQRWKEDLDDNIRIEWTRENPSHIKYLKVFKQTEPLTLDLSELTSLEEVNLYGSTNVKAPLDLSKATGLRNVFLLGGSNLLYNDVKLPEGFDKNKVDASSQIYAIGTPRENGGVEVPVNTVIDLAKYVGDPTEGCTFTYSWRKNWGDVTLEPVEGKPGSFKLTGQVNDNFCCEIESSLYPNWSIWTPTIYLTQGEMFFDAGDVAGLKKLATDNPQNQELQDFITNKGWEKQNWDDWNARIRVKWVVDDNNNARLSHLRLNLQGCYDKAIAPTKIDLSAFTELVCFNTSSNYYVNQMDFSKNTKLEEIYFEYANTMTQLDLSPCENLKWLTLDHLQLIETVDLTSLKLRYLQVWDNPKLKTLKLGDLSFMGNLRISTNLNLEQGLDLSAATEMYSLYLANCPKLTPLTGVSHLSSLNSLELEHTASLYKEALQSLDFSTITRLNYQESDYELPAIAPNLTSLVVAQTTKEVDLDHFPNLNSLSMGWYDDLPALPYSGIKHYRSRESISYGGKSVIPLPGAEQRSDESYPCITSGQTINLSTEAVIEGKQSHFIWIDGDNDQEEKDLFVAVEGQPGCFTIDPTVPMNESGKYRCRIWNEAFSSGAGTGWDYDGWILETETFKIKQGEQSESTYNADEVAMLQNIVKQSTSEELKAWWSNDQWKNSGVDYSFEKGKVSVTWNDDKRLTKLKLTSFGNLLTGTLNLSAAEELEELALYSTDVEGCIFPANPKLQSLDLYDSKFAIPAGVSFPSLRYLYLSDTQTSLDLGQFPVLSTMEVYGQSTLKYSAIQNPRKVNAYGQSFWNETTQYKQYGYHIITNFVGEEEAHTVNFSSETEAGATVAWEKLLSGFDYEAIDLAPDENGNYDFSLALQTHKSIRAKLTHPNYMTSPSSQWYIYFNAMLYTEPGDANIDGAVNVLDIAATLPYVLKDDNNQLPIFGYYQADQDHNEKIEVADVVAIVNRIKEKATSGAESAPSSFKSAFVPKVYVTSEADGKLYVDTQVPLAGVQLTFTGVEQEIPLLGEAARFAHAAHASDSLRMVAYSMDGRTIPAGRTLLAQLPKGATLVEALFADANAQSLKADLSGIVTATEEIGSAPAATQVTNYPNPFRSQTTFTYGVPEQADQAVIRIYATNGALVHVLNGLPVAPGENQYRATIDLPAGLYLYRLEISRAGRVINTQTNNLIIK